LGNEFYYKLEENGQSYILISKGKDGLLNRTEDIRGGKNLP